MISKWKSLSLSTVEVITVGVMVAGLKVFEEFRMGPYSYQVLPILIMGLMISEQTV